VIDFTGLLQGKRSPWRRPTTVPLTDPSANANAERELTERKKQAMATKKWSDLRKKRFSAAEIAASREEAEREVLELNLRAVRELIGKTQADIAEMADLAQGEVSRVERRDDHLVSTLRRYVEALGGELEVPARFEDKRNYRLRLLNACA